MVEYDKSQESIYPEILVFPGIYILGIAVPGQGRFWEKDSYICLAPGFPYPGTLEFRTCTLLGQADLRYRLIGRLPSAFTQRLPQRSLLFPVTSIQGSAPTFPD
jgi:hypothetical protein